MSVDVSLDELHISGLDREIRVFLAEAEEDACRSETALGGFAVEAADLPRFDDDDIDPLSLNFPEPKPANTLRQTHGY